MQLHNDSNNYNNNNYNNIIIINNYIIIIIIIVTIIIIIIITMMTVIITIKTIIMIESIYSRYFYSVSSSPNYSIDTVSELTRQSAKGNCELRTCPRSCMAVRAGFEPATPGRKAPNLQLSHHVQKSPNWNVYLWPVLQGEQWCNQQSRLADNLISVTPYNLLVLIINSMDPVARTKFLG